MIQLPGFVGMRMNHYVIRIPIQQPGFNGKNRSCIFHGAIDGQGIFRGYKDWIYTIYLESPSVAMLISISCLEQSYFPMFSIPWDPIFTYIFG